LAIYYNFGSTPREAGYPRGSGSSVYLDGKAVRIKRFVVRSDGTELWPGGSVQVQGRTRAEVSPRGPDQPR